MNQEQEVEKLKQIISDLLEMWERAAEQDDACVGYKGRQAIENRALAAVGRVSEVKEPSENWREGI